MFTLADILAMSSPLRLATIATIASIFIQPSLQQTYTSCDPLKQSNCPADPALGRSISADFTSGPSDEFTADGNPTYHGSDGVAFTVSAGGDAPQLMSNWYIMFGKYEITMKAAPGAGIVSSVVLQSDDLDEIDWEFLGAENDQVQLNYFGKGQTTTYDRMTEAQVDNSQGEWHTYGLEWTEQQIVWSIDGAPVRTLTPADADAGQYPQTPCQLKFGSWSGGDSSNPQGTITWAKGPTDYSQGPFTMYVQKISVVDYSTGSQYMYGDQSGSWSSIESKGGRVNGNVGGGMADPSAADPTTTASVSLVPFPGSQSGSAGASGSYTSYPGLPSGWTVNPTTGKVVPPSSAPLTSQPASSTLQPASSAAPHCSDSGFKTITGYNQRGFPTTVTVAVGVKTTYNDKGLPVTVYPSGCEATSLPVKAKAADGIIGAKGEVMTTVTSQSSPQATAISIQKKGGSAVTIRRSTTTIVAIMVTVILALFLA